MPGPIRTLVYMGRDPPPPPQVTCHDDYHCSPPPPPKNRFHSVFNFSMALRVLCLWPNKKHSAKEDPGLGAHMGRDPPPPPLALDAVIWVSPITP